MALDEVGTEGMTTATDLAGHRHHHHGGGALRSAGAAQPVTRSGDKREHSGRGQFD
jgi:hypothetical protein